MNLQNRKPILLFFGNKLFVIIFDHSYYYIQFYTLSTVTTIRVTTCNLYIQMDITTGHYFYCVTYYIQKCPGVRTINIIIQCDGAHASHLYFQAFRIQYAICMFHIIWRFYRYPTKYHWHIIIICIKKVGTYFINKVHTFYSTSIILS